ncbi:alpha/beta fold hydrolase [Cupriavidus taiwanensis]|uniref:alpha/beta fold hydrolase n=2 Tax=Cupriavidus taiwanensis TaxID=164546 RepID=UPI0034CFAEE7
MPYITIPDGTRLFYKDWGAGRPVVLSHGWPANADAWDAQMLLLVQSGFRVIAHDRRGHGRSDQPASGNDIDTYADDLATLISTLDLQNATLVGHSIGGGEIVRYISRHGSARVAKAVLIAAPVPLMARTETHPDGVPLEIFDGIRNALAGDRSQFFRELAVPFYGLNRPQAGAFPEPDRCIPGAGHDGWHPGPVRLRSRVLRSRLHGRSEAAAHSHAAAAWR